MKVCGYDWPQGGTKQVVYVDSERQVIELVRRLESPWQSADLTELTGAPPSAGKALVGYDWYNGNTKQVAYVDDQRHVIELVVAARSPWQWTDLTALTAAPPPAGPALAAYGWIWGATKQVAYFDDSGHVIELCVGLNGQWQSANLTALVPCRAVQKVASEETGLKA